MKVFLFAPKVHAIAAWDSVREENKRRKMKGGCIND